MKDSYFLLETMWTTSFPSWPARSHPIYRPVPADPSVLLDAVVAVMAGTAPCMQVCSSGASTLEL